MATPINAPMAGEIWHLSIEDLFQPVQEAPRLGGNGPFVINLSVSTAPIGIPTKAFTASRAAHVYQIQVTEDGRTRYRLRLGPFVDEDDADAVLAEVRDTYPGALTATAGAADLRVIANMQAKADTRQPVARAPAEMPVAEKQVEKPPMEKPVAEKVAAISMAADEPTTEEADAEISIDMAWPTPALVVPPLLPLRTAAAAAPQAAAPATVAPVPVPIAAPVLTEEVALKPKAPAAAQRAAAEKAAAQRAAAQKAAAERAATEKAAAQKAAAERAATEKAAAQKAAAERAAAERAAAERAAAERAATERAAAQKAAAQKAAAEKAAAEKAAAEKAAAEKAAAEKAATEKAAMEKAAAQKAAMEKAATEKAAATLKAPTEKPMQVLRQSVASPLKAFAKKMRPSVIIPPTRLTSLQHVVVATAPVPAAREVKKLDKPLDSLESTQTMRALTPNELEDTEASRWFVIQLALADRAFDPDAVPNLDLFSEYRLYSVAGSDQGRVVHSLRLGFFREEIAAVAVASYLGAFWDKPTIKRVSLAERERFADQRVEARKDVGATGRHAVIEITDELVARRRRASRSTAPGTPSNPTIGH
jgi:sporulation related protein